MTKNNWLEWCNQILNWQYCVSPRLTPKQDLIKVNLTERVHAPHITVKPDRCGPNFISRWGQQWLIIVICGLQDRKSVYVFTEAETQKKNKWIHTSLWLSHISKQLYTDPLAK